MTLEVVSLGCRLNLSESESLRGLLSQADNLTVINSCAVTAEAVRQTRQAIRRARKARPDARLLVTGCAAEVERAALAAMPEVDGLVGNLAKLDPRAWNVAPSPAAPHAAHTRAFVDVQTGCDHACTFCVIPQGRGPSRSRSVAAVLASRVVPAAVVNLDKPDDALACWCVDSDVLPERGSEICHAQVIWRAWMYVNGVKV